MNTLMNQNKIIIFTVRALSILGFIVLILFSLEAGFKVKSYFKNSSQHTERFVNGSRNILIVGDSVLGGANVDYSIFKDLKGILEKPKDSKFQVIDQVQPGNYSGQVNFSMDKVIANYHPEVSVVLLGNSDFIVFSDRSAQSTYLPVSYIKDLIYQSHLFKLYITFTNTLRVKRLKEKGLQNAQEFRENPKSEVTFKREEDYYKSFKDGTISCLDMAKLSELRVKFFNKEGLQVLEKAEKCNFDNLATEDKFRAIFSIGRAYKELGNLEKTEIYFNKAFAVKPNTSILAHFFWIAEGKKDCVGMFRNFDLLLKYVEPRGQLLWTLRQCFIKDNKIQEGVKYFTDLSSKLTSNKQLSLFIAQSLAGDTEENRKMLGSFSANRDQYLSTLYYYKLKSKFKEANELYRNKNLYIETNPVRIDLKNFRQLLSKLTKDGGRVIVLQYPNQSDWPVLEAIAPFGDSVSFIGLSSILEKNLDKYNIFELLADDFLHVTPVGSKIIAEELSLKINNTKVGSNEK